MPVSYFNVTDDENGQRIDNFLFVLLKGVPKTRIYKLLRKGEIRVNKKRIKPEYKLQINDVIRIPPVRIAEREEVDAHKSVHLGKILLNCILYQDDHVIVLNKPSGVAVHGGSGESIGAIEALRSVWDGFKKLELIHRIDKDTSGCLLIAKKRSGLRNLHEQIRTNQVKKNYLALLKGNLDKNIKIEAPLVKNTVSSGERIVKVDFENGKPSLSLFNVKQKFEQATLVDVKLITGRTHQIRVHSQYKGHPIAGDLKYGDNKFNNEMKSKGLKRLFLHASELSFISPSTNERVNVTAPLDEELKKILKNLD